MTATLWPLLASLVVASAPGVVEPDRQGVLVLPAERAALQGPGLTLDAERGRLQGWRDERQHATWSVQLPRPQSYHVVVEYAMTGRGPGGSIRVRVAGERREAFAAPTGTVDRVLPQPLVDPVALAAGRGTVTLEAPGLPAGSFLSVRAVRLIPVNP